MFGLSEIVIKEIRDVFEKHHNINEVIIFGSRAKGNYKECSDIDLAVKGDDISYNQLLDISNQIDDIGILYKVDIIDYGKDMKNLIVRHIDRVGKLFYQRDI